MFHPDGPTFVELARQALSSTERGYDLLAPKFDVTPFRTPEGILGASARYLRSGPLLRNALDLCCGTGAMLQTLEPVVSGRLVGLDFSRGMLLEARGRGSERERVHYVRGNALRLPFVEGAFDLVTCFSALGHFLPAQHVELVRAVARCLAPGGRFLFVTGRMPSPLSASYWISRSFNAAMHLRNAVRSPRFTMYYLTFLLPEAQELLEQTGFAVRRIENAFGAPFDALVLVDAKLRDGRPRDPAEAS